MWSDNETDLDLLGFDELVDELVVALTAPDLLPLTVGVLGDWGSGKSSLLKIARRELEAETEDGEACPYLCVDFSPWLYEDYEDVKTALMGQVLAACRSRATEPEAQETAERLSRFAKTFGRRGRTAGRAALAAAPALVPAALAVIQPDLADTSIQAVQGTAGAVAPMAAGALEDEPAAGPDEEIRDLPAFRREFKELVASLDGVTAVVVFIDDLDRCLPETVVDTFEAIRLFLNSPQTAYVVAASRQIVESAIDSRYPELTREGGKGIGHDYLEKMLQLQVTVPPLSTGQTESYLNLLIAQLHLSEEDFAGLRESLRAGRANDPFAPTFNAAAAREALGGLMTAQIEADLAWTGEMSEVLSFLRGNPRQVKRFLNELTWRRRAAARRGVELRHDVLAKLMVLEEQNQVDFQTLFDWHRRADGPSPELALAESQARGAAPAPDSEPEAEDDGGADGRAARRPAKATRAAGKGVRPEATTGAEAEPDPASEAAASWLARPKAKAWLLLQPELGHVDLRPYFSYFRDRLTIGSAAAVLRPGLQVLVAKVLSDVPAQSRAALDACKLLTDDDQDLVVTAVLDALARRPDSALYPACEFAARMPRTAPGICEALAAIPHHLLPPFKIPGVVRRLDGVPGSAELAAAWAASPVPAVSKPATAALRPRAGA